MSAVDSGLTIEPPDLRERWRWLDGPAPFADSETTLEALAMRLVDRERTPLSYGEWACVLQWHDNPAELGEKEGPGTVRHYELAFWVHNRAPLPGDALRIPGPFVESALLTGSDPEADSAALQRVIARVLIQAAIALDAQGLTTPEQDPLSTAAALHRSPRRTRRSIAAYAAAALIALLLAIGIPAFVVTPYLIPSSSMASTLAPGQHVLVDRMAFRLHLIDRGDVIVWRDPQSPHELALRRVVALPGDLLVWRADLLFVNGVQTAVQISDLGTGSEAAAFRATGVGMAALRSAVHPYRVSAGDYLVVAENGVASGEAGSWEIVARQTIVGQVLLTYWPPDLLRHF